MSGYFVREMKISRAIGAQRYDEALRLLDEQASNDPSDPYVHAMKAHVCAWSGDDAAAELAALRALELDAGNFMALRFLTTLCFHNDRHDEGRTFARRALAAFDPELDPSVSPTTRKILSWLERAPVPGAVRRFAECVGGVGEDVQRWLAWASGYAEGS